MLKIDTSSTDDILEGLRQPVWDVPQFPQSQDSLSVQLAELIVLAKRFGLYDATEWVISQLENRKPSLAQFSDEEIHSEAFNRRYKPV